MEKYLIVTDTTSAMDQEIAQKNGIELISLSVIVDGHEYKDQIDISTKQLYDYLRDGKIPSTSQPNTGYLVEQMEKWQEEDYEAIMGIYDLFSTFIREKATKRLLASQNFDEFLMIAKDSLGRLA